MVVDKISIIIPCVNGLSSIDECISALSTQNPNNEFEIIVINCCEDGTSEHIQKHFPEVILIESPERFGIPKLRAMGISRARGNIIAIIEDHCIVSPNWLKEIRKAHNLGYMAVGGAVENASTNRLVDWAAFFCEYSNTMLPIDRGEVDSIPGNNASYNAMILDKINDYVKSNFWEFFIYEELRKMGIRFYSTPDILVHHKKEFGFFYFLSQRYHYSRSFAAMRNERISSIKRFIYILTAPILPPLLIFRMAMQVIKKKRHLTQFALSLPVLIVFMLSYAAGELTGYLFGSGNSLNRVE